MKVREKKLLYKMLTTFKSKSQILDFVYPVGSIYMTMTLTTVTQVQNALGGTWVAWGAGRVPVSVNTGDTDFNASGKTGGAKTVTLTTDQIPSHNHAIPVNTGYHPSSGGGGAAGDNAWAVDGVATGGHIGSVATGGGKAHTNMPPYITCYMYRRTA